MGGLIFCLLLEKQWGGRNFFRLLHEKQKLGNYFRRLFRKLKTTKIPFEIS